MTAAAVLVLGLALIWLAGYLVGYGIARRTEGHGSAADLLSPYGREVAAPRRPDPGRVRKW